MLIGTITANGNTLLDAKSASQGRGNFTTVYVWGDFSGGTLKVQATPDGFELFDLTDGSLTAKGFINIDVKTARLNLNLAGAATPSLNYAVM